jgi:hypothetical protein
METTLTEQILDKIKDTPPTPRLLFTLNVSERYVRFNSDKRESWQPTDGNGYLNRIINKIADSEVHVDPLNKVVTVDRDDIVNEVKSKIGNDIKRLFIDVSYNKSPKMTKAYKSLVKFSRSYFLRKSENDEITQKFVKILEYYDKVTTESELSIKHEDNKVHRKNLYSILLLMEKKYGDSN